MDHTIRVHEKLTAREWERALWISDISAGSNWAPTLRHLLIDLSQIGWVEPVAVVRMVLLIEALLDSAIDVTLALPCEVDGLLDTVDERTPSLERRQMAGRMLRQLRLEAVLHSPHLAQCKGRLLITDLPPTRGGRAQPAVEGPVPTDSHQRGEQADHHWSGIFPLQWIGQPETDGKAQINRFAQIRLEHVINHPSGQILEIDTETIAQIVLTELVDNTVRHGGRRYALVAAWQRSPGQSVRHSEALPFEHKFVERAMMHPVVEVIVGDSGRGVPATLQPAYQGVVPRPVLLTHRKKHVNDQIIAWSFNKWSSREDRSVKVGTRGLYRVAETVRKYGGFITVRSEGSYVGVDPVAEPWKYVAQNWNMGRCPGTVTHIRIPVKPSEDVALAVRPAGVPEPEIHVVGGLDAKLDDLIRTVNTEAEARSRARRDVCVVVDLSFRPMDRKGLAQFLTSLAGVVRPVAVVVVANIGTLTRDELQDVCRDVARAPLEGEAAPLGRVAPANAILLLQTGGRYLVAGADGEAETLFADLSASGYLERPNGRGDREAKRRMTEFLHQYGHLVEQRRDGLVTLRFDPERIYDRLADHTAGLIGEAIRRKPERLTRIPAVYLVRRWVDIYKVIRDVGIDSVLSGLARKLRATAGLAEAEHLVILADSRVRLKLLNGLAHHMKQVLPWVRECSIRRISPFETPTLPKDAALLLFTDLMVTGNSAERVLDQSVKAGKRLPLAVATIMDIRRERDVPIWFAGASIPVVSMYEGDFLVDDAGGETPEDRNPISLLPEEFRGECTDAQPEEDGDYLISQAELHRMLVEQNALFFSHVAHPNGRHLLLYLNEQRLLWGDQLMDPYVYAWSGDRIIAAYEKAIREWMAQWGLDQIDLICYPYSERPAAAEQIATELASRLEVSDPIGLRTAADHQQIRFPPALRWSAVAPKGVGHYMVVVDWGALTGASVRELMRLGAASGAKAILVVTFLGHTEESDEEFARRVHSLWPDTSHQGEPVSVTVRVLARFPMVAYDWLHCPHCQQLRRFRSEYSNDMPELLKEYVLKSQGEISPLQPTDLRSPSSPTGTDRLEQTELLEMALFRQDLLRARSWTHQRYLLYAKMQRLLSADTAEERMRLGAVMALLAVEWNWLKQEPLLLSRFSELLKDLAVKMITDRARSVRERADAIVVLRVTAPESFAEHLPALLNAILEHPSLVARLLYCTYTYLKKEYQIPESLDPLVRALDLCQTSIYSEMKGNPAAYLPEAALAVMAMYQLGERQRRQRTWTPVAARQELIRILRERFGNHHPATNAIEQLIKLCGYVGSQPAFRRQQDWNGFFERFRKHCDEFLSQDLPALIGGLRPVLNSSTLRTEVRPEQVDLLGEVGMENSAWHRHVSALKVTLGVFAADPDQTLNERLWGKFKESATWIWDMLLQPETSVLHRLLTVCATDLDATLARAARPDPWPELDIAFEPLVGSHRHVFCDSGALAESMQLLLDNVRSHTHAEANGVRRVQIQVREEGPFLTIRIRNAGQANHMKGSGKGQEVVRQYLTPFEAELSTNNKPSGPWSYEVVVKLQRCDV